MRKSSLLSAEAVVALLIAGSLFAADAPVPAPTRENVDLTLQTIRAEKDKYVARLNWGQALIEEAQRMLPLLVQRENELVSQLKQIDEKAKTSKDSKK